MTPASDAVFAEFHRRLRAFVSRRVRDPADVEDVVQETFLRIHRHLGAVRNTERLASWVFQIARNAIVDHYQRGRRPEGALGTDGREAASGSIDTHDEADGEIEPLAACLAPMIESLSPSDRQAIELAEIAGLTQREASARAGVTLSGMKSRVQRARRKLKTMLLECCHVELDRRGGIVDHEPRNGACGPCRPRGPGSAAAKVR